MSIELKTLKWCIIVFLSLRFFLRKFFYHEFYTFKHAHIFFSFIVVCIHLKCYTTNDVHFIIDALCEKRNLQKIVDQKKKDVLFFSIFFLCIFGFCLKTYFDICFDNLINIYVWHHYHITQVIWYQLTCTFTSMF